jgi:CRISPR-associated exonuclease Cas4
MTINATLVNLYHVCKREMWLHANGIRMEHTSDVVAEGKLIGETTYPQRAEKYNEIELSATINNSQNLSGKVDFYDARNKVIHETKKSDSAEEAHEWQVKFYLWLLALNGVEGATGILEYPKLRHTSLVTLSSEDSDYLQQVARQIKALVEDGRCPARINSKICKSCSYFDFCYVEEVMGDEVMR